MLPSLSLHSVQRMTSTPTVAPAIPAADPAVIASTTLIDVVFPESANHYGTLFGGRALEIENSGVAL